MASYGCAIRTQLDAKSYAKTIESSNMVLKDGNKDTAHVLSLSWRLTLMGNVTKRKVAPRNRSREDYFSAARWHWGQLFNKCTTIISGISQLMKSATQLDSLALEIGVSFNMFTPLGIESPKPWTWETFTAFVFEGKIFSTLLTELLDGTEPAVV